MKLKRELHEVPDPRAPFLYEVWNWEGDPSILPIKWFELLQKHDQQAATAKFSNISKDFLVQNYINNEHFDPKGFFFITHRSECVAGLLAWPKGEICEIKTFAVLNSHWNKGVPESIVALALNYAKNKGFNLVECEAFTDQETQVLQNLGFRVN